METIITISFFLGIFLPAFVLHECAHGWEANRRGDSTAKRMGRLTLNPIKHLDLFGSFIVPVVLFLAHKFGLTSQLFILAWGKPVPVNYFALNNPKKDMMWVALAGPIVNIILAVFFSILYHADLLQSFKTFFAWSVAVNIGLAVFNMVPIPPLDGSRVVSRFLPNEILRGYLKLERYGILIILLLLNFGFFSFVLPTVIYLCSLLGVHVS